MMAMVIIFYYALYLPAAIEGLISYEDTVKFYINKICNFLFFANALINPFIYAGQSSEFNAAYRKMLRLQPQNQINLKTTETQIQHQSSPWIYFVKY